MRSRENTNDRVRTPIPTRLALVAFAAKSLLYRLALGQAPIDAGSFSAIRLVSSCIPIAEGGR